MAKMTKPAKTTQSKSTPDVAIQYQPAPAAAATVVFSRPNEPGEGDVAALTKAGVVTGKAGESVVHLKPDGTPLIVIGLGETAKQSPETFRIAGGKLAKVIKKLKLTAVALPPTEHTAEVVTGFVLGRFEYRGHKGTATAEPALPPVTVYVPSTDKAAVDRAVVIAESQNFARTIATRPGNDINPPKLAEVAKELAAEVGLKVRVIDEAEMKRLGMGGILGVGAGSATPPRMIVLEHAGKSAKSTPTLVVGKSITFDTGGISIKGAAGMQGMVFDKCGGMAVLGLMRAAALLKMPQRIVGILAAAENHISGTAYRPGDILTFYNGVTAEITNTDAEGRLVLADALSWGIETYKPSAVVDLATLTGSCVIALGHLYTGLMSNSDELVNQLQQAARSTGEKMWRLPLDDEHREKLKSTFADVVNAPGREAGTSTAAAFLSHFVPKDGSVPWAHLDIAGTATTEKALPYYGIGATGWGVRTLVEWVGRV